MTALGYLILMKVVKMHKADGYTDKIVLDQGILWRIVTAEWKDKTQEVYRVSEYEQKQCKYLYFTCFGGWYVCFPGEKLYSSKDGYYYSNETVEECDWQPMDTAEKDYFTLIPDITQNEIDLITSIYPAFSYVFKKLKCKRRWYVMQCLQVWKYHPQAELLFANGYDNLAFNKSFWHLTEKQLKKTLKFLKEEEHLNYTLIEIQTRLKYNIDRDTYIQFLNFVSMHGKCSYPTFTYLIKQVNKEIFSDTHDAWRFWKDYQTMLKSAYNTHNPNELYWKYPADLMKAHNKLDEEIKNAIEAERAAIEAQKCKDNKNMMQRLRRIANKYSKYNTEIDGYSVIVSGAYKDWKLQAETLHQCIISADYIGKMSKKQCLIVFVRKNNEPVATAEIKPGKKLGQFYANEQDRNNCTPTEEVKTIFNKYFEKLEMKEAI